MLHGTRLEEEWFAKLSDFDRQIAEAVAAAGCRHCGGPLYQGNYERKPRGGRIAEAGEAFTLRHSLCCGREGCRKRALPPSLRFSAGACTWKRSCCWRRRWRWGSRRCAWRARSRAYQHARCADGTAGGRRRFRARRCDVELENILSLVA